MEVMKNNDEYDDNDMEDVIEKHRQDSQRYQEEIRQKMYCGWRYDENALNDFFQACVLNWKVYENQKSIKQISRLYGLYKQATIGDCDEIAPLLTEADTPKYKKWFEWDRLKGMPSTMAKRRYITYLAEIDPMLLHITPNEKPPDGFPHDENGHLICGKCNTHAGCTRPLLDDNNNDLRKEIFERDDLGDLDILRPWVQHALQTQRCVFGIHKPITKYESKKFTEWFLRLDNNGFCPYNSNQFYDILKDFLKYHHQVAYDIQLHREEYSNEEFNQQYLKATHMKKFYQELTGHAFIFEVPCHRDIEVCNQRRVAEKSNHLHPVELDSPLTDYSCYEDAVSLRLECQRLKINPCTGVIKDVNKRCEIYRQRISEYYAKIKKSAEAKTRNELRPLTHNYQKQLIDSLSHNIKIKQLSDACHATDTIKLMKLIRKGSDPNFETSRGLTPLLCAVLNGAPLEVLDELVEKHADVNHINIYGYTPLMMACRLRDSKMVHFLLRGGARPSLQTPVTEDGYRGGDAAIHWCAMHSSEDEFRLLLGHVTASEGDSTRVAKFLNVQNAQGFTPLMLAASRRNGFFCRILILAGADTNIRNRNGRNAAMLARNAGWGKLADWLGKKTGAASGAAIETYADMQYDRALRFAIMSMRNIIQQFCSSYLSLLMKDQSLNFHPFGSPNHVKKLLAEGSERAEELFSMITERYYSFIYLNNTSKADRKQSAQDEEKEIPLSKRRKLPSQLLSELRQFMTQILAIFKEGNITPDYEAPDKPLPWTPLMCAAAINDVRAVKYMIREGADVNYCNKYGTTAIMLAAQLNSIEALVELILSPNASLHTQDNEGFTALAYATTLPPPKEMEKDFVHIMTDTAAASSGGQSRRMSAEELLRSATTQGLLGLRELVDRNTAQLSEAAASRDDNLVRLMEGCGLSPLDSDWRVKEQLKSAAWRLPDVSASARAPRSAGSSHRDSDRSRSNSLLGISDAASSSPSPRNDNNKSNSETVTNQNNPVDEVLRCPLCTLPIPCTHFLKKEKLLRYLKKKASGRDSEPAVSVGKSSSKLTVKQEVKVAAELLHDVGIDDRDTDRSLRLVNEYRRRSAYPLSEMPTGRLLSPSSPSTAASSSRLGVALNSSSSSFSSLLWSDSHDSSQPTSSLSAAVTSSGESGNVGFDLPDTTGSVTSPRETDDDVDLEPSDETVDSDIESAAPLTTDPTAAEVSESVTSPSPDTTTIIGTSTATATPSETAESSMAELNTASMDHTELMQQPSPLPLPLPILTPLKPILKSTSGLRTAGGSGSYSLKSSSPKRSRDRKRRGDEEEDNDVSDSLSIISGTSSRRVRFFVPGEVEEKTQPSNDVPKSEDAVEKVESPSTVNTDNLLAVEKDEALTPAGGVASERSLTIVDASPDLRLVVQPNPLPPARRGLVRLMTGDRFDEEAALPPATLVVTAASTSASDATSEAKQSASLSMDSKDGKDKTIISPKIVYKTVHYQFSGWMFVSFAAHKSTIDLNPIPTYSIPITDWSEILDSFLDSFLDTWLPMIRVEPLADIRSGSIDSSICIACNLNHTRWNQDVRVQRADRSICFTCFVRKQLYLIGTSVNPSMFPELSKPLLYGPTEKIKIIKESPFSSSNSAKLPSSTAVKEMTTESLSSLNDANKRDHNSNTNANGSINKMSRTLSNASLTTVSSLGMSSATSTSLDDWDSDLQNNSKDTKKDNGGQNGNGNSQSTKNMLMDKELVMVPFLIASGHYLEAERLLRNSLNDYPTGAENSPATAAAAAAVVDIEGQQDAERAAMMHSYRLLELQAELYKQMGLWPLVLALYLDMTDIATGCLGYEDPASLKSISLVVTYLRKVTTNSRVTSTSTSTSPAGDSNGRSARRDAHDRSDAYLSYVTEALVKPPRNPYRDGLLLKIESYMRLQTRDKIKLEALWTKCLQQSQHLEDDRSERMLPHKRFHTFGLGGYVHCLSSLQGYEGSLLRREYLSYCQQRYNKGDKELLLVQFILQCIAVRVVDEPDVFQHLFRQLIQKYFHRKHKSHKTVEPTSPLKYSNSFSALLDPHNLTTLSALGTSRGNEENDPHASLVQLLQSTTTANQREAIQSFLKHGTHIDATVFDKMLIACIQSSRFIFRSFLLHRLTFGPSSWRDIEYLSILVTTIQTRWRVYHATKLYCRRFTRINIV